MGYFGFGNAGDNFLLKKSVQFFKEQLPGAKLCVSYEDPEKIISVFKENFSTLDFSDLKMLENNLKEFLSSNNLKFPQLGKPLRLILAGRENAPSISQLLFFLGFEESCLLYTSDAADE